MIVALAGRRVDSAVATEVRFPLHNLDIVRSRIRSLLESRGATTLVCSAACGADLLALAEAEKLGLHRRVVLPFSPQRFRETSVTDRPGDWGDLFDDVLRSVPSEDLTVLERGEDDASYSAVNLAVLDEACELARRTGEPVLAAVVWDGQSRGDHDLTQEFGTEARRRHIPVTDILTL